MKSLETLNKSIVTCGRCPELRAYCAEVGRKRRKAYEHEHYWARPVPGLTPIELRSCSSGGVDAVRRPPILLVGLAPGAHGANRTGRMFTGDRSGDFLYAALHRAGLCSQPTSTGRDDGLQLHGVYISAACRCAPPSNKPTRQQLENCRPFLIKELQLLRPRVLLCLGSIAWSASLRALQALEENVPRPLPKFGHGVESQLDRLTLLGSYHVSQQNTFTGRLTEEMFDAVVHRALEVNDKTHSERKTIDA